LFTNNFFKGILWGENAYKAERDLKVIILDVGHLGKKLFVNKFYIAGSISKK
jgi:hypothetical protein